MKICVVIKTPPTDERFEEGLRSCIGLTLTKEIIKVLFVEYGKEGLKDTKPEKIGMKNYREHLKTLNELGVELKVVNESQKLAEEIKNADRVIII